MRSGILLALILGLTLFAGTYYYIVFLVAKPAAGVAKIAVVADLQKTPKVAPPVIIKVSSEPIIDPSLFEDGGLGIASQFTGAVRDPNSLQDLKESIENRGKLGLTVLKSELEDLRLGRSKSSYPSPFSGGFCARRSCR